MNSFNDINGIPATANQYIQRNLLKENGIIKALSYQTGKASEKWFLMVMLKIVLRLLKRQYRIGSDMDMESRVYMAELQNW